jgi:hypothetical protein
MSQFQILHPFCRLKLKLHSYIFPSKRFVPSLLFVYLMTVSKYVQTYIVVTWDFKSYIFLWMALLLTDFTALRLHNNCCDTQNPWMAYVVIHMHSIHPTVYLIYLLKWGLVTFFLPPGGGITKGSIQTHVAHKPQFGHMRCTSEGRMSVNDLKGCSTKSKVKKCKAIPVTGRGGL